MSNAIPAYKVKNHILQVIGDIGGDDGNSNKHWGSWRILAVMGAALFIYGVATLLRISLLRYVPLNKAYVFMALSFVLAPIASFFIFRKRIAIGYWAGVVIAAKF